MLASCGAVYCNRSCLWVCNGRAGGQPAHVQCLHLSERFFRFRFSSDADIVRLTNARIIIIIIIIIIITVFVWTAKGPGFESWLGHLSRVGML